MDPFILLYPLFQIFVFLLVLGILWRYNGWYAHTNTAASILTVIGVLGTFIGIYIGLQAFNTDFGNIEEMQKSISELLNALKLAFLTSIFGIASALLLKGIISPLIKKNSTYDPEQQTMKKLANALKEALVSVETSGESNLSSKLETLTKTITADNKANLLALSGMKNDLTDVQNKTLTQLETLTNTVSDEHNQLRADRETTRSVLGEMRDNLTDSQGKILDQLETLTKTVADKNDLIIASQKDAMTETHKLLTDMQSELTERQNKAFIQLRTLTKTVSYEHTQLRKEFDNFSKNVAESITELATKELISSLTKVIDQFNTQLSTQFGDNFKQLNEAVGKTVAWQEQYRQQMDKLADEFRIAAKSIDNSRVSLKDIADSSATIASQSHSIVTISNKLEPILHTLNDQLEAFSDLRQKANDAFPLIEKRLDDLTTKFSSTVGNVITDSEASMKTQLNTLKDHSTKLTNQFDKFESVIDGLDDFTNKIEEIKTGLSTAVVDFQTSMGINKRAVDNFISSVAAMESTLDKQLTDSISELGNDLAALSEKFVDDYTPLTRSLRQVLTIAEGILPQQPGN